LQKQAQAEKRIPDTKQSRATASRNSNVMGATGLPLRSIPVENFTNAKNLCEKRASLVHKNLVRTANPMRGQVQVRVPAIDNKIQGVIQSMLELLLRSQSLDHLHPSGGIAEGGTNGRIH
jgi:hypothetical protein